MEEVSTHYEDEEKKEVNQVLLLHRQLYKLFSKALRFIIPLTSFQRHHVIKQSDVIIKS